jgi:hypothetical protein
VVVYKTLNINKDFCCVPQGQPDNSQGLQPLVCVEKRFASPAGTAENIAMAETYASLYIHLVSSTKDRQPTLRADLRKRILRSRGCIWPENAGSTSLGFTAIWMGMPSLKCSNACKSRRDRSRTWPGKFPASRRKSNTLCQELPPSTVEHL